MIVTRQSRIPFSWLLMMLVPWVFFYFLIQVNGANFFILNRLIDNPATLTFVMSLPGLLFMFVPLAPYLSYTSDRIWTRWGRRKIFLITGLSGMALVMFLYPLAPNILLFVGVMFLGAFFSCFNCTFEALKLEIVPPGARGRLAAFGTWTTTAVNIVYYLTIIGRFDEDLPFVGIRLSGVKLLFWSAAIGLLIAVFIYVFGVHEVRPKNKVTGEKFSVKRMFKALTMPQLRYLYVFGVAHTLLASSLGSIGTLLYINQWGYTMQEMGFNIAVGGVINLFLIPVVGFLADAGKGHNRMKIWLTCLGIILMLNVTYFSYVTWYLPDQRPSLVEIIFFGETTCIFGIIAGVMYYPLVYDYIPRNLMGTYFAGSGIIGGIVSFISFNCLGLFMSGWASLFQPPAGEMAQVCLKQEMTGDRVAQILYDAGVSTPEGGRASRKDIVVNPWFANGIVQKSGLCQEVRLRDPIGEKKFEHQKVLKKEIESLKAKKTAAKKNELEAKIAENTALDRELKQRAEFWSREVTRGLDGNLIEKGGEILGATRGLAVASLLPTVRKAGEHEVDKLNNALRAQDPGAIGVRIIHRDNNFFLSISSLLPDGGNKDAIINACCTRVTTLAALIAPGLIGKDAAHTEAVVRPVLVEDVAVVEPPVPTFVSPISRVVNAMLSRFTEPPPPNQKLISLARTLGAGGEMSNARVDALPNRNGLHITKVLDEDTTAEPATVASEFATKVRTECASLKLTVPTPLVAKDVVPIKYNYLAGYLYVFGMVVSGFVLVGFFLAKEKAGVVRKLGAEEAEKERALEEARKKEAATASAASEAGSGKVIPERTYTPGYLIPKLLFAGAGLAAMLLALEQAWPQLRLLVKGEHAEAVATSVCARNPGQPDEIISTQAALDAKLSAVGNAKDYNWTFFNDFAFETKDGKKIAFRRDVGCKLKPPMRLLDASGLPSTAGILYDPKNPNNLVMPLEYSSWFLPALIGIFGFMVFLTGSTLAFFARKPIELAADDEDSEAQPDPAPTATPALAGSAEGAPESTDLA